MRILVTFAIKAEFSPWSSRHPFVPYEFENWERRREFDLFKANIGHNEVTVLLTGMGKENAVNAMASIPIDAHDVCISSGLAGALVDVLPPGAIIAAGAAQTLEEADKISSDHFLFSLAYSCGASPVALSLTSDKIASTAAEKEALHAQSTARIVEMESAHILSAAQQAHVPAVVIRAISDAADEDLPLDFARVLDSRGNLQVGGLLKEVGLHPYRIAPLIQFGRQSRSAAKALADFLDEYLLLVAERWPTAAREKIEEVPAL
jgi:adenosylhomocysteine nucleosidase